MPAPAAGAAFLALIPARLGSTPLPDKPLADIGGVPMVVRVARARRPAAPTRVVVCADSARVVEACERHGVRPMLTCDGPPHRHGPPGRSLRAARALSPEPSSSTCRATNR
jgi:3-deoxy-manno-octulosonate cytidylyltransferase (CMP-KDO synthetase)